MNKVYLKEIIKDLVRAYVLLTIAVVSLLLASDISFFVAILLSPLKTPGREIVVPVLCLRGLYRLFFVNSFFIILPFFCKTLALAFPFLFARSKQSLMAPNACSKKLERIPWLTKKNPPPLWVNLLLGWVATFIFISGYINLFGYPKCL